MPDDKNCSKELNRQLQGLQARLKQAEDNIQSQFNATSMLAMLCATTTVPAAMAIFKPILNGMPFGFEAMMQLVKKMSPEQFEALILQFALAQLDIPSLASLVGAVEGLIQSQIAKYQAQLQQLISNNAAAELIAEAQAKLAQVQSMSTSAKGFIESQARLPVCKTLGARFAGFAQ